MPQNIFQRDYAMYEEGNECTRNYIYTSWQSQNSQFNSDMSGFYAECA